jgi:transcriptional regulator with XRE-family HTH domain
MSDSHPLLDKDKLQEKRIRARLTQAALARKTGLHQTHIGLLEKGRRGTTPETLGLLADALGCDIDDLRPDKVAA